MVSTNCKSTNSQCGTKLKRSFTEQFFTLLYFYFPSSTFILLNSNTGSTLYSNIFLSVSFFPYFNIHQLNVKLLLLAYQFHVFLELPNYSWTEKPGRPQSVGLQRVGHYWARTMESDCFASNHIFDPNVKDGKNCLLELSQSTITYDMYHCWL